MRKTIVTYILVGLLAGRLVAQSSREMSNGSVNIVLNSNGLFFSNKGIPGFETPVGSGKQMVNLSSFWLSALDQELKLRQSIVINPLNGVECWAGPIDTFKKSAKTDSMWDYIWQVNQHMIQTHRNEFNKSGYVVPEDIKTWPGSTRKGENLPAVLAPYFDVDADSKYDNSKGDFPFILGNQSSYFICNDVKGEHLVSSGPPMTTEMQMMTYFVSDPQLKDVVFLNAHIINRSDFDYKDLYIGFYTDLVLGKSDDNFVGTDVKRNMVFGYNGDADDEGAYAYGKDIPAFGVKLLNQKTSSSSSFYSGDLSRNFPKDALQVRNSMEGKWTNGSEKRMIGKGIDGGVGEVTNYIYPWKSDPSHPEIDWQESISNESVGLRNMLIVSGPYQLEMGKSIKVDLALMAVKNEKHISKLNELADLTQTYYQNALGIGENAEIGKNSKVWPNPIQCGETLYFDFPSSSLYTIIISDMNGRIICSADHLTNENNEFLIDKIRKGFYLLEIKSIFSSHFQKLFIQ